MQLIGLTGGIGSGKSTVSNYFKSIGCAIIDADVIAHKVVEPGSKAWKDIVKNFGQEVLLPSQQINRQLLGSIVFTDPGKRKILNRCTHPYIRREIVLQVLWYFLKGKKFVILDSPLLFESKLTKWMKKVIVIYCSEQQQVDRIVKRNNFTEGEAKQRITSQMPLSEKRSMADYVIDNSGTLEHTRAQVMDLHQKIRVLSQYHGLHLWILIVGLFILVLYVLLLLL